MRKLESLKTHLLASLKHRGLQDNPADLHFAIPTGSIRATSRVGLAFEYSYTLSVGLFDFAGSLDEVSVAVLLWIQRHEHALLAAPGRPIEWEVELLDDDKCDILFRLPLSETVNLSPRPAEDGGGSSVVHPEAPLPMALETGSPMHAVYVDDTLIGHCTAHPTA